MNTATTLLIPFQQYYFFTSDCGSFPSIDSSSIASILGKVLLIFATRHPSILADLTFFEKEKLRTNRKNCVPMVLGSETIASLRSITKCGASQVSLLARALLKEYIALDGEKRQEILAKI
jgi:hypothetical protein